MSTIAEGIKLEQSHGKGRIRVARLWRDMNSGRHSIVEWNLNIKLLSDCLAASISGDNADVVPTDTMKNTVYAKAKECSEHISVEEFGILLGWHFTSFYPMVTVAVIIIMEKPWERVDIDGQPHNHGFKLGSEKHITEVTVKKNGDLFLNSGVDGLALLKTTQSGFEGFLKDQYTLLPETRERLMATKMTAMWRYNFGTLSAIPGKFCFVQRYLEIKEILQKAFFGPPKEGVYSPSVQNTLYLMGKTILTRFTDIESVSLKMPNLHFLPVSIQGKGRTALVKFNDDIYLPTDEPHGTIEATLSRLNSRL